MRVDLILPCLNIDGDEIFIIDRFINVGLISSS